MESLNYSTSARVVAVLVMSIIFMVLLSSCGKETLDEVVTPPTSKLPIISASVVFTTTENTATCGGNISSDGGATINARGLCWSKSPSPTISSNNLPVGSGIGSFTGNLTGLTPGTIYYVRAYATNSVGTAYGNEVSFTTNMAVPKYTVTVIVGVGCTASLIGSKQVPIGDSIKVSVTLNKGYDLESVFVNKVKVPTVYNFTFKGPTDYILEILPKKSFYWETMDKCWVNDSILSYERKDKTDPNSEMEWEKYKSTYRDSLRIRSDGTYSYYHLGSATNGTWSVTVDNTKNPPDYIFNMGGDIYVIGSITPTRMNLIKDIPGNCLIYNIWNVKPK